MKPPLGRNANWLGPLQTLLYLAGFAAAYMLTAQIALLITLPDNITAAYYPAAGLALAALLFYGPRALVVVLVGEFAVQLLHGSSLPLAIELPAAEALGAIAAWHILTNNNLQEFRLRRSRDLGRLALAGLAYGICAASGGIPGLYFSGQTAQAELLVSWWIWGLGDALGVITIVPLLFAWRMPMKTRLGSDRFSEAVACAVINLGAGVITFFRGSELTALRQPLAFPTFALQVWAALRFGVRGAAASTLAMATLAIIGTALGHGPFAGFPGVERALVLQGYILLHALMGLMLAVMLYERERAEEELRRQKEYLHQVVDISPNLIFVRDRFHRFVFVNQALANLYGVSIDEMLGKTDWDFSRNPEHSDYFARIDREVLESGEERVIPEEQIIDREGRTRWLQVVKRPLCDEFGIPRQVLGVATDMTAWHEYERQITAQKSYLRQIVDINPSLIYSKDLQGRFVLVNSALADAYGVTPQELIGKIEADFNRDAVQLELSGSTDSHVIATAQEAFIPEQRLADAAGNVRWLQTIKRPVFDEQRNVIQVLAVATDITARKRAEEERRELEQRMQQAQQLESIGILAGGIAHDFNNLLVGILGNADLALLDLEPDSMVAANLRRIRSSSLRATELANQMLAYAGKGRFTAQRLDLNRIVAEVVKVLGPDHPQVHFGIELAEGGAELDGDEAQLLRLLTNLVLNSIDALPESSGEICIRTRNSGAGKIALEVQDNGAGMDEQTQARMFEPFFSTKFTGRGLGLAAVIGIVRGHGAEVEVESTTGQGTLVRVLFAATDRARPQPPSAQPRFSELAAASRQTLRSMILVVDDDPAVCSVARRALTRHGFRVLEAHNGTEALAVYQQRAAEIDAVLLDLTMPEMSGDEVLTRIRELNPEARIVLSSGYSEYELPEQFGVGDQAAFLQKPYEVQELVSIFRRLLGNPTAVA
jgi:two-component system cell cycle sensor histidine kinase/response regulator CckA